MTRRRLLTLLCLGVIVAGCNIPGAKVAQPPPRPSKAHPGGTLTVGIASPGGVDPLSADTQTSRMVVGLLCDTLISINPKNGRPEPGLAQSWLISGSTITLTLRHHLRLADGTQLSSSDVAYALSQLANPRNASPEAGLLGEVAGYGALAGNLFASNSAQLQGVSVVDPYDVQISLTAPDPGFLMALAEPATAPYSMQQAVRNPAAFARDPDCVGPYRLVRPYSAGDTSIELERSPHYYAENVGFTGGGGGYANRIELKVYPTEQEALDAQRFGVVDAAQVPVGTQAPPPGAHSRMVTATVPDEEFVGLPDGAAGIFSHEDVRRALSEAIDRQAIAALAWAGSVRVATAFLPTSVGFSKASVSCANAPKAGNVAAARSLLSVGDRRQLSAAHVSVSVNSDSVNVAEMSLIATEWHRAFGMTVTVVPVPWSTYLQQASTGAGFEQPFRMSWSAQEAVPIATYPDPSQFLRPLFDSLLAPEANLEHFESPQLAMTASAVPANLGLDRNQQMQSIGRTLCTNMPIIPVVTDESRWLISDRWTSARGPYLSTVGIPLLREFYR